MINFFVLIFGIIQLLISIMEFVFPGRSFRLWNFWISNRFFPVHGAFLIFTGFPLIMYKGYLSSIIFYIGLVVVLSGPFVLIYPEKIREAFSFSSETFKEQNLKKIVRFDAFVRLITSVILIFSYCKS